MNFYKIKDSLLLASVFLTGSAVLIIEIIAIRIFAPYYGNTIYTTSSVIGVVLAALSLGYYIGGLLSDKYPKYSLFYGIIFISGFAIIFAKLLINNILPSLSLLFSITIGSLVSSIIIFFIPSFLMGMLSPFAVKLHKKDLGQDKIGSKSGEVFFWSTLGSINGSLLAGFVLIPYLGINLIIISTGIILSIWGLVGLFLFKIKKEYLIFIILFLLFEIFIVLFKIPLDNHVLYEKDGLYEKIKISDGKQNRRPARFLAQDKSQSAGIYLDSDELLYDYTKYYKLYKLINPNPNSAFFIGGGAYSMPKALLKEHPTVNVSVAEIEPELFLLAKKYFNLQENPRLTNYIEDGRRFLSKNENKYDIIVSDVYYSFFSIPIHFTTKEFFELAKNRLNDNGVFIGNFAGDLVTEPPSLIFSEIKTFKETFSNSYFFAVKSVDEKTPQNIIFLGIKGSKEIDFKSDLILNSKDEIIKNLEQKNIDISNIDFTKYNKLTDDFSPVEYLISKVIYRWY